MGIKNAFEGYCGLAQYIGNEQFPEDIKGEYVIYLEDKGEHAVYKKNNSTTLYDGVMNDYADNLKEFERIEKKFSYDLLPVVFQNIIENARTKISSTLMQEKENIFIYSEAVCIADKLASLDKIDEFEKMCLDYKKKAISELSYDLHTEHTFALSCEFARLYLKDKMGIEF